MKTTVRHQIAAAAMLLLPMGAMLSAQPAAAQDRDFHADRYEFRHDRQAPRIFDVTPSQGDRISERGATRISARFQDERSGVDLRSVHLRVDGRDVTARARVDGNDIRYADDLRPGRHVAELVLRDRAGNLARQSWSFEVRNDVRGDRRVGYGYGR
jgi:hypothetical protein